MAISFALVTLGCAKNEVDSDRMRALLLDAGIIETADTTAADVVILNTCSFLEAATAETIEMTLELAEERFDGLLQRPIVMCGCVPSRYSVSELASELPEIAAFVRHDEEDGIVEVVRQVLGEGMATAGAGAADAGAADAGAAGEQEAVEGEHAGACSGLRVCRTVQGASAFVKISDGCDRFCTFCAIPYIRGGYYSRPAEDILREVASLAAGGVREIVLIGQDTGVWGTDLYPRETLASLLVRVAEIMRPYGGWVRVLYLQPEGMTDELVQVMRDTPEVLPYIDIPIQHCNEAILQAMGRSGSRDELAALFAWLRSEIPTMVLRSTGMCGFPGETDEAADELYDFIAEQAFDYTSVFSYSAEEGTVAATLEGQVDEALKLERTQRLMDLAESLGFAATARHVGERVQVIIDGVEEGDEGPELVGHAWFQAPDSDGAIHITEGDVAVGDVVTCELYDAVCYELYGRIVDEGDA